jgi:methionyl-tRNA formyltransferase
MRLVFMGTPEFSVAALQALIEAGHEIACVYSQPPRPAGRGYALKPSPVHALANARGIEVRTPVSLKSAEEQNRFAALNAEAAVVVAYGLLLPKPILDAPRFGCFNIHASLLPRWRGAAPIQRAIMAGDTETGVTIMKMDVGLDTGPMLLTKSLAITPETTYSTLHDQLMAVGSTAIVEALKEPDASGQPQPEAGVTYAHKINKTEAHIDFSKPADSVRNHIHGLSPFPGAWCMINGTRIKILRARVTSGAGEPGTFINNQLSIACGEGALELLELQREGKGAMQAQDFIRGYPISTGTKAS